VVVVGIGVGVRVFVGVGVFVGVCVAVGSGVKVMVAVWGVKFGGRLVGVRVTKAGMGVRLGVETAVRGRTEGDTVAVVVGRSITGALRINWIPRQ
jgi:hypothetical protein